MKRELVMGEGLSLVRVARRCPWARVLVRVEGGVLAFESEAGWRGWLGMRGARSST